MYNKLKIKQNYNNKNISNIQPNYMNYKVKIY